MDPYIHEIIEHETGEPKIFITSIKYSCHHWHYDHELILVLKGSVVLNAEGENFLLKEGDLYWINSRIVHSIERKEDNLCLFIQMGNFLFYSGRDSNRHYSFYLNSLCPELAPQNGFDTYRRLAANIGLEHQKGDRANIHRIRSYIYEFVANLMDFAVYDIHQHISEDEQKSDAQLLMQIIAYVQQEYWQETVVEDSLKKFGMSEKTMYRFLKKYLGFSLKDLVMETRLEQARTLLKNTDKPISWIAATCGFGSEITLYRSFRKSIGITPSEYRKNDIKTDLLQDQNIQGYLGYNPKDAYDLLTSIIKGETS